MPDAFRHEVDTSSSPSRRWAVIVPSDAADVADLPKALRIDQGGTLALMGSDGTIATFAVFDGETLPLRPKRVMATGTTATGIKALY